MQPRDASARSAETTVEWGATVRLSTVLMPMDEAINLAGAWKHGASPLDRSKTCVN